MGSGTGPLMGGQPAAYWRPPFDERCRYHAPPGVTGRDVSKVGLVPEASPQDGLTRARLRDKVLSLHVTERKASEGFPERRCRTCGRALPPGVTARRRFCGASCRKRANRERKARAAPLPPAWKLGA
jgi:predicted nucleic acid-binding Zn ribbon protein